MARHWQEPHWGTAESDESSFRTGQPPRGAHCSFEIGFETVPM